MSPTLPPLPVEGEQPWYTKRNDFDSGVRDYIENPQNQSVPVFNVLDYGAKPYDYEHDSAPAINAACQAAHDALGGEVIIPVGEYFLESPIGKLTGEPWAHVNLHGTGWRGVEGLSPAATRLVAKDNFSPIAGAWRSCRIANMNIDADMKGAPAIQIWIAQTTLEYLEVVRWQGAGMELGGPEFAPEAPNDLGYLNTIRRCNISDYGDEWGASVVFNYRFTDSLMEWCNLGSPDVNLRILGGGPYRVHNTWFNSVSTPKNNVVVPWGVKHLLMTGCVFEGAEHEAFLVSGQNLDPGNHSQNIVLNSNIFIQWGFNDLGAVYPAISVAPDEDFFPGVRFTEFVINGNSFRSDKNKSHVIDLIDCDAVAIVGNTWLHGHPFEKKPVRVERCYGIDVIGNGGDNEVEYV